MGCGSFSWAAALVRDGEALLNTEAVFMNGANRLLNSGYEKSVFLAVSGKAILEHVSEDFSRRTIGLRSRQRTKAARDFLLHLGHAHGLLSQVVGKRYIRLGHEAPNIVCVIA